MASETIRLTGHIIDSLTLSKILDIILRDGGQYRIKRFEVGATRNDASHAEITVSAPDNETLERILHLIQQHGAERTSGAAQTEPASADGVLPDGFYATTNLETAVRRGGRWLPVEPIEMDCALVVSGPPDAETVTCLPMHRVRKGDAVVVGYEGVRVTPVERLDPTDVFGFMGNEVSTERPKELVVAAIAQTMQEARAAGQKNPAGRRARYRPHWRGAQPRSHY